MRSSKDFAYLAGLIDGDGCISSYQNKYNRISITSKNKYFLSTINSKMSLGFKVYEYKCVKNGIYNSYYYIYTTNTCAIKRLLIPMFKFLAINNFKASLLLGKNQLQMKTVILNMQCSEFLSYLAGFFDAEGCIQIFNSQNNNREFYLLCVDISNTNFDLLTLIKKRTNLLFANHKVRGNRLPSYLLYAKGRRAQQFLSTIYPYMILKRELAQLALAMPIDSKKSAIKKANQGDIFNHYKVVRKTAYI